MSSPTLNGKTYRVAQWATGNVGSRALRNTIQHPHLELVGVWVHGADKVGRDAGELAGLSPIGIKATNDIEQIISIKPDCVLYMPHICNFDEICRILEAGINIVTTRMELQNPKLLNADIYQRVQQACEAGNSSIHATGSSPGFISEAVPLVLSSIQRRLDNLSIHEFADVSSRNSPEMLFDMMGFGRQPGPVSEGQKKHIEYSFGPSLQLVASAVGLPIDKFEADAAVGLARSDVHIAAGVVPAGTVAATRTILTGMHKGKPLINFSTTWFVSTDVDTSDNQQWKFLQPSGWHVVLQGDCPIDLVITFPVAPEDYAAMTPGLTANRPVNAIPYVCEAPAGICTSIDLPQIIPELLS